MTTLSEGGLEEVEGEHGHQAHGKLAEEPTRPGVERLFFLDDADRDLIALRRSTHHQIGLALPMCTVRTT
ncbi:DUF4158 domain-containing protein [Streptomyces anulatus]|nr:DUF4158 domain-containing protein [Streptomyces sp. or3]WTC61682.1 DUF4158 domain-containing protein [Streptomyces anulatus]WTC75311.1 DUF4158 domain-containing protein [Streptomyces anulatus]WUD87302.1 DUF4158 domain-containing protein [Streptomyces anulatus]